jgi:hypothetical protein
LSKVLPVFPGVVSLHPAHAGEAWGEVGAFDAGGVVSPAALSNFFPGGDWFDETDLALMCVLVVLVKVMVMG